MPKPAASTRFWTTAPGLFTAVAAALTLVAPLAMLSLDGDVAFPEVGTPAADAPLERERSGPAVRAAPKDGAEEPSAPRERPPIDRNEADDTA
ncbi:MAG: hypothetical protein RH859_12465 [Longimicrobiales bacterium]